MRLPALLLALALLAVAAPAHAQAPTFPHAYQVRGALGDIPTTAAVEPAGAWNLEQRLTVQFDNSSEARHAFGIPEGARLVAAACSCGPANHTASNASVVFTLPTSLPSGSHTLTVATAQAVGASFGFTLRAPLASGESRMAILYVPAALDHEASVEGSSPGLSTDGQARIVQFDPIPSLFWASIHPATAAAPGGGAGAGEGGLSWPVALGFGAVAGIALWAVLVQRGLVQRKGRRQVAATAAHVEAAAADPPAVLEGKKRALLAALKEIEVAKMNQEMPTDVYDAVKADLKKQAVTVMRALETAGAAAEPKA